jgi:hypothetical protein
MGTADLTNILRPPGSLLRTLIEGIPGRWSFQKYMDAAARVRTEAASRRRGGWLYLMARWELYPFLGPGHTGRGIQRTIRGVRSEIPPPESQRAQSQNRVEAPEANSGWHREFQSLCVPAGLSQRLYAKTSPSSIFAPCSARLSSQSTTRLRSPPGRDRRPRSPPVQNPD